MAFRSQARSPVFRGGKKMRLGLFCNATLRRVRAGQYSQGGGAAHSPLAKAADHLRLAVEYEKKNGFCNIKGKEHFDVFLSEQLERVEQSCPLHLRRELSSIREQGLKYSSWPEDKRQEYVERLGEAFSALNWFTALGGTNGRRAMGETPPNLQLRAPSPMNAARQRRQNGFLNGAAVDGSPQRSANGYSQASLESMKGTKQAKEKAAALLQAIQNTSGKLASAAAESGRMQQADHVEQPITQPGSDHSSTGQDEPASLVLRLAVSIDDAGGTAANQAGTKMANGFSWGHPAEVSEDMQVHNRGLNGAHSPEALETGLTEVHQNGKVAMEDLVAERRQSGATASTSNGASSSALYPKFVEEPVYEPPNGEHRGRSFCLGKEGLQLDPCCLSTKYKIIVFDTETSGGALQRIVELGAYSVESGKKFCSLVNPHPVYITDEVVKIHGITNAEVRAPEVPTFREVGEAFVRFVEQEAAGSPDCIPILLAHNFCSFDYKRICKDFKDIGMKVPQHWHFIDTLPLARLLFPWPMKNKQSDLIERFHIPVPDRAHRALDDVLSLAQVVPHLLRTSQAGNLDKLMAMQDFEIQHGSSTGIHGRLSDLARAESGPKEARMRRKEAAEARKVKAAAAAARLSVTTEDPINKVEKAKLRQPIVLREEGRAGDVVTGLPSSWVEIMKQPIVSRPFIDIETNSSKAPFTPKQRENLTKIELATVGEVLQYYPRDYLHCSYDLRDGEYATVLGTVVKNNSKSFGRKCQMDLTLEVDPEALRELDSESDLEGTGLPLQRVTYKKFVQGNFAFHSFQSLVSKLPVGGMAIAQGRVTAKKRAGEWELDQAAQLDSFDDKELPRLIVPVYAARSPVAPKDFDKAIPRAIAALQSAAPEAQQMWECLPSKVCQEHDLMSWFEAIKEIHAPSSEVDLEEARRRLAFEELLLLQLTLLLRRELSRAPRDSKEIQGAILDNLAILEAGRKALPYTLTKSQENVLDQIVQDLQSPLPMLRLLQGDVGCGKTVVAFLALLAAAGSGYQGAMMAPTEVLTEQHFRGLSRLVEKMPEGSRPRISMLTGSTKVKDRRDILAGLADGSLQIIIGTHALVTDNVAFAKLGLAVIDEQHKFGVEQRAKLQGKASPLPHVLAMTATPIPRTLALVTQGDMAFCAIDEMPPGRRQVATTVLQDRPADIQQMYAEVKAELSAGGRAFIIYPLIEESSTERFLCVKAAEDEFAKLQDSKLLGDGVRCGLLHGRMTAEEKQAAVACFSSGETPVLVSTSLVEVGMDVPEASIMVVNHAERFGLAQLHQLRGRVGRGERPSMCFLVNSGEASARQRLALLAKEHSGLQIAEADLAHRGQGDVMGKQQSGKDVLACLRAAKLPEDRLLMEQARETASELIARYTLDPAEWPPALLAALAKTSLPKLDYHHLPTAVKE